MYSGGGTNACERYHSCRFTILFDIIFDIAVAQKLSQCIYFTLQTIDKAPKITFVYSKEQIAEIEPQLPQNIKNCRERIKEVTD